MPRVTISINAPDEPTDQDLLTLDLPLGLTVKDLKALFEVETNFPAHAQTYYLNGSALTNETLTLEAAGIKDGEMLAVLVRRPGNRAQGERGRNVDPSTTGNPNGPSQQPDPENVRLNVLRDPAAQEQLKEQKPELFAALNDATRWREVFNMELRRVEDQERERQNQVALLNNDPFNIDAQRKIEEIIRQDRVIENLQHAYEHNPEVFARVHMLYINTEVNNVPVKAFVDSGAQATIMSPACAERCGIMRLIDKRYSGIARGVGTAKILGRVHHAEIKIGGAIMPCAFTVMEGKGVDLLFGLDMLKRYKAKIDLEKNALCFQGLEIPFLAEHEIPKDLDEAELNEPTVAGPNGTAIGARTGAPRPADATAAGGSSGPSTTQAGPSSQPLQPQAEIAPQQPKSTDSFPQEHIEQLINLGFSRQEAIQALQATGGNVEYAAGLLFGVNEPS